MFNYTCLNPIAGVGLDLFSDDYKKLTIWQALMQHLSAVRQCTIWIFRIHCLQLPVPVQVSTIFRLTNVLTKVSLYLIHRVQMPMV